jgi:hypothetical protein
MTMHKYEVIMYWNQEDAAFIAEVPGCMAHGSTQIAALSSILNGRTGISPEMAIRLSIAFDTTAESWLNQQVQYDLWQAEQHCSELQVKKLSSEQSEYA